VAIPREFWKVIVFERDNGKPGAAAFILTQADQIKNLPKEEFEPGEFSVFQVSVDQLEEKTKLDFGEMRSWDTFSAEESFETTGGAAVEIALMSNIWL
jgi:endonuclease G